ncbi:MAG: TonB-dependent receptor [Bacteroides sp.]|nr:TonB-dependent receptor [Bacteroides sp.]
MKIILITIVWLACFVMSARADNGAAGGSLKGRITDAVDGREVIGASIYFPELKTGTSSDMNGAYVIDGLPARRLVVQVSYVGHQTLVEEVDLSMEQVRDFVLHESNALINEVVVTGLTGNSLLRRSPSPMSMVTQGQLAATSSTNLIDAIAREPGVSQITTGGSISKPVIRGLGYNRVVVVNDGVRQEGQQWGDEHGVEIDAQTVGSVEILKGPAGLMYGSDALAGVLIFHDAPTPASGEVQADATTEYQSNNGLLGYSVHAAGNRSGFVWRSRYSGKLAHAYKNAYDGYVLGTAFREQAFTQLLGLNHEWGYSHLKLSYYHQSLGIAEGERDEVTGQFVKPVIVDGEEGERIATRQELKSYGHPLPYQHIRHYKVVWDNAFAVGAGSIKALVGYQLNRRQEYEEVLTPNVPGLDMLLHTVSYDVHYVLPLSGGWRLAVGVGGMYQRSLNEGDEYLIPSYNLFDYGVFATASRTVGRWSISGGLRYDSRHLRTHALEEDGEALFASFGRDFRNLSGSLGATYQLSDGWSMKLNLARGFRAPNISELSSNGVHEGAVRYELGNAALKPETSLQADWGLDYTSPWLSAQLALFASRIHHYIFISKLVDGRGEEVISDGVPTYQYTSGDARIMGGEAWVDIHPVERLHFANTFSYVRSVQLDVAAEAKYLPMTPAPRWRSELKYDFIRDGRVLNNLFVGLSMDYNLRQSHYYAVNDTETPTPSYCLWGLSAGVDIQRRGRKWLSLYLSVDNLTDCAYQSHLSRLKYTARNNATGRTGIYNMGRNASVKLVFSL